MTPIFLDFIIEFVLFVVSFTTVIMLIGAIFTFVFEIVPEWKHKREVNRRIIRQAKALGVWGDIDKMGGRVLELYARKHWAIYREEGETDAHLRMRIKSKRKGQF